MLLNWFVMYCHCSIFAQQHLYVRRSLWVITTSHTPSPSTHICMYKGTRIKNSALWNLSVLWIPWLRCPWIRVYTSSGNFQGALELPKHDALTQSVPRWVWAVWMIKTAWLMGDWEDHSVTTSISPLDHPDTGPELSTSACSHMPGCLSHPVEGPWDHAMGRVRHHRNSSSSQNWPHPTRPTTETSWAPKAMQILGLGSSIYSQVPSPPPSRALGPQKLLTDTITSEGGQNLKRVKVLRKSISSSSPGNPPDCSLPHPSLLHP